jgi:hypothetical protein
LLRDAAGGKTISDEKRLVQSRLNREEVALCCRANSWQGVVNITLSTPTELWLDLQPATRPQRYYRVVHGPISLP